MSNEIAIIEKQLGMIAPSLEQVLTAYKMPVARLMRTVMVSVERLPKLMQCNRQSLLNSAMTAACLGLEVDGVTGQGFLIPFKDKAQFITGYKGFNTMGARSGFTLTSAVVREGDEFDMEQGTNPRIHHKKMHGNEFNRKILLAYAIASMPGRTPIIRDLSIDEIMAIKNKAPGGSKADSPWNEPYVGFPAMAEKSAKRRLARDMPLNTMVMAAALEDQLDLGRPAYITPDKGVIIDGEPSSEPIQPKTYKRDKFEIFFTSLGKPPAVREDITTYKSQVVQILDKVPQPQLRLFKKDNKAYLEKLVIEEGYGELEALLNRIDAIEE